MDKGHDQPCKPKKWPYLAYIRNSEGGGTLAESSPKGKVLNFDISTVHAINDIESRNCTLVLPQEREELTQDVKL